MTRQLKPCGTDSAYRRHLKRGEKACPACCRAHAEAWQAWRERARRRELIMPENGSRTPAACGTQAGYKRHLRQWEWPCDPCREANNEESRRTRRRRAAGRARARRLGALGGEVA